MSYQVLARKWRPRTFHELVGQEHVQRALVNALDQGRLHHAYLFTGTRGVGKTTLARILAKCLNCTDKGEGDDGVTSTPCGRCDSCQSIDQGRFVDLIEVDAASRTKVEDTRELLDNVQYAPTQGRYKVYLIDEVHMLSTSSFNALLKTLEEPPPHVKFLLATTDPQKLPPTVLSRCLQFTLKHMPPERIVGHLSKVLEAEQVPYEESALWLLGKAAAGSMRDAMSLTDQSIAFGQGEVRHADVAAMLGTLDHRHVLALIEALAEVDAARVLREVASLAEQGPDFGAVLDDLTSVMHRLAIGQMVPSALDNGHGDREALLALAAQFAAEDIQLYYQIGVQGRADMAHAPDARTALEMTLLRMLAFRPQGVPRPAKTPLPMRGEPEQPQPARAEQPPQPEPEQPSSYEEPSAGSAQVAASMDAPPPDPSEPSGPSQPVADHEPATAADSLPPWEGGVPEDPTSGADAPAESREPADAPAESREPADAPADSREPAEAPADSVAIAEALPQVGMDGEGPHEPQAPMPDASPAAPAASAEALAASQVDAAAAEVVATSAGELEQEGVSAAAGRPTDSSGPTSEVATEAASEATTEATNEATTEVEAEAVTTAPLDGQRLTHALWLEHFDDLAISGLTRNLAAHCIVAGDDGERLHLQLDPSQSAMNADVHQNRIRDALEALGYARRLEVDVVELDGRVETPRQMAERLAAERHAQAVEALKRDPHIQQLQQTFGARLVESTVTPAGETRKARR
ncbi:DNA polymerase III subunit gamma/tau [Halomonas denitrificans]|uniref:DNA polymerase III subunit gamma/tau n=1 Tax=Halomonas denitrificans TaxID=370769 RepID=UPI001C9A184F|nr:DNA polymerase III subunit gamma/tau [Halomonas denitrificans]MBY5969275.1 DNA polymerase III subunit gamma/tau [Halomonas denitrificans]